MLPSFDTDTYYRILAGNEDLALGQARVVGELADGSVRRATTSADDVWQMASEEVEHALEGRGSSVAVYVVLNDRDTLRLYSCDVEMSIEILPTRLETTPRLRVSALAA